LKTGWFLSHTTRGILEESEDWKLRIGAKNKPLLNKIRHNHHIEADGGGWFSVEVVRQDDVRGRAAATC